MADFNPRTLRVLRESRGLTQELLARQIGRTALTVSRYENGVICPPSKVLDRCAEALGVEPDVLYSHPAPNVEAMDAALRRAVASFGPLHPEIRRRLILILSEATDADGRPAA